MTAKLVKESLIEESSMSSDILNAEPEIGTVKKLFLKKIKDIIGSGQSYTEIKGPFKSYYDAIAVDAKNNHLKKSDIIDFINYEIGIRTKDQKIPALKNNKDFINQLNTYISSFYKMYKRNPSLYK